MTTISRRSKPPNPDPHGRVRPAREYHPNHRRNNNMWTKPSYTDLRIGFEVTLYFANR